MHTTFWSSVLKIVIIDIEVEVFSLLQMLFEHLRAQHSVQQVGGLPQSSLELPEWRTQSCQCTQNGVRERPREASWTFVCA